MSSARRSGFWNSSSVRLALLTSLLLWLANSAVVLGLYNFTVQALVGEVAVRIERDVDQRLSRWPRELPHQTGVSQWLYRQLALEIASLDRCAALVGSEGEEQISNIEAVPESRSFHYEDRTYYVAQHAGYRWAPERHPQPYLCLVREHKLPDGGVLTYGRRFDSYHATLVRLDRLRFWGLLGTAALSLALGTIIALRALHGIRRINQVCDQVARGDLSRRIHVGDRGHDLDHLGESINHMLDQIEQLMGGIRQVSDAIAHDLKTPLARLRGQLELLLNLPERNDEAILAVIAEADQVLSAFNALLRIAQLEQGTTRQALVHFDFRSVVSSAREIYELVFAEKHIDFQVEVAPGDYPVLGDRDLWLQALTNLLDNAYKYTPESGWVRLALDTQDEHIRLVVEDSGPGIPDHEHRNVFKRFYRLDRHRGQKGTGLGLSLVAAVCGVHHAEIELSGQPGLRVTILLPRDRHAPAAEQ